MTDFNLSPGITPELTDLFLLEFTVVLGVAYFWRGGRAVELVIGLNAVALGVIKAVTDWSDLPDLAVALAAIVAGGALSVQALLPGGRLPAPAALWVVIGLGAVALGLIKVALDFYDPFDLLLAALTVVAGFGIAVRAAGWGRGSRPSGSPGGAPVSWSEPTEPTDPSSRPPG
jgi:hypothetical protein